MSIGVHVTDARKQVVRIDPDGQLKGQWGQEAEDPVPICCGFAFTEAMAFEEILLSRRFIFVR